MVSVRILPWATIRCFFSLAPSSVGTVVYPLVSHGGRGIGPRGAKTWDQKYSVRCWRVIRNFANTIRPVYIIFFFFACFSQRLDYRSGDCSNIGAVVHEALRRTYRRLKNIQNITRFHKYINIYLVFKIYTHCLLLIRHLSISSSLISKLIRMS